MSSEEIEAQPEWYLNKDDNYWVDKHIKELKMESDQRTEDKQHHLMWFAITAALITLFFALFLVIIHRVCQLIWGRLKRVYKGRTNAGGDMQFNSATSDEEANEDVDDREREAARGDFAEA